MRARERLEARTRAGELRRLIGIESTQPPELVCLRDDDLRGLERAAFARPVPRQHEQRHALREADVVGAQPRVRRELDERSQRVDVGRRAQRLPAEGPAVKRGVVATGAKKAAKKSPAKKAAVKKAASKAPAKKAAAKKAPVKKAVTKRAAPAKKATKAVKAAAKKVAVKKSKVVEAA